MQKNIFILNACKYVMNNPESAPEIIQLYYDLYGIDIEDDIDNAICVFGKEQLIVPEDATYHQRRFANLIN